MRVEAGRETQFFRQTDGYADMIEVGATFILDHAGIDSLIATLSDQGYRTVGPIVRDGAIVPGPISGTDSLPAGWHDIQAPGSYRLQHRDDADLFGWSVGPQSWKASFLPASETLWHTSATNPTDIVESAPSEAPLAIIGARACDLAGLALLDEILIGGAHIDHSYARRRLPAFVIVAECTTPAATCFCSSMNTGPEAEHGFDLALIELGMIEQTDYKSDETSRVLFRVGSSRGGAILEAVGSARLATQGELDERSSLLGGSRAAMGRTLDTSGLRELLARNIEHPRWEEVAKRCLSCGNCTMVCPSCFCTDVNDVTDLRGGIERERHWASCFDLQHSYLHGGAVRSSSSSRYRQWAVHKLSTWHDQFGTSGCVGCGRCITWCPVGIDITEEVAGIRATDGLTQAELGTRAAES